MELPTKAAILKADGGETMVMDAEAFDLEPSPIELSALTQYWYETPATTDWSQ
jgi:hypothetical protein